MITTRLMGGIGNQMFQYAAGFALSSRLNVGLQVDRSWFDGRRGRVYRLDVFAISAREGGPPPGPGREPGRVVRTLVRLGLGGWMGLRGVVIEPRFTYWPGFRGLGDGSHLHGYWQSERYFEDVGEALRREFTFRVEPDEQNRRMLDTIRRCEAVSLHVRRGDYADDARSRAYHGAMPLTYYEAAVRRMMSAVRDPVFFVFSDDPEWVKDRVPVPASTVHVAHNGAAMDYEDLRLMSACRHAILANSTFSWWGAWLGETRGQHVIAPARWFRKGPDTRDLLPARWERI